MSVGIGVEVDVVGDSARIYVSCKATTRSVC